MPTLAGTEDGRGAGSGRYGSARRRRAERRRLKCRLDAPRAPDTVRIDTAPRGRIATTPRLPDPPATRDARRYRAPSTLSVRQLAGKSPAGQHTTETMRRLAQARTPSRCCTVHARLLLASHSRSRTTRAGRSRGGGSAGVRSASLRPSGVHSSGATHAVGRGAADTLRARDMLIPRSLPQSKRAPRVLSPLRDAGLARVPAMGPALILFILLIGRQSACDRRCDAVEYLSLLGGCSSRALSRSKVHAIHAPRAEELGGAASAQLNKHY
ncbi:hypothetical protein HETIRDRAFT_426186 [Heterobasidion irregulare TC 32-1]|uniref:Uncharacterized protein n=1 Tax=Heterobasidion irregulare (strain TC 32-1) TaxID=747525 RepID=W4K9U6_HETIT|nr:uncharacterized protein HETIRDRAFT_426186 [Heterobasidion irregulare TC 32-1]ETW82553.1 hypothetical protein HETIRDRAFT_426186 [Heterobasidion irregulare TC 32-1]